MTNHLNYHRLAGWPLGMSLGLVLLLVAAWRTGLVPGWVPAVVPVALLGPAPLSSASRASGRASRVDLRPARSTWV